MTADRKIAVIFIQFLATFPFPRLVSFPFVLQADKEGEQFLIRVYEHFVDEVPCSDKE